MPGTNVPNTMYDHECNVLKGWWDQHSLDKAAPLASGQEIAAGRVFYLDQNGEANLGLPDNVMPIFALGNSDDFDVQADFGNTQSEVLNGLPATGGYELQTTEYDTSYTFDINDFVTAWSAGMVGAVEANYGKIFPADPYANTICGVVSKGITENEYGKNWVSLWTYFLPVDLEVTSSVVS